MADIEETARRREIRRRKILDNSEARWQKIMGQEKKDGIGENIFHADDSEAGRLSYAQPFQLPLPRRTSDSNASTSQLTSISEERIRAGKSRTMPGSSVSFEEARLPSRNTAVNGTVKRQTSLSGAYAFPKKVSDAENRSYCLAKADSHRRSSCAQLVLDTLQIDELSLTVVRSWIVILLAGLVRLWCNWAYDWAIAKSIFVPFFTLEASFCLYNWLNQKVWRPSHSMLGAALLLCGISPSVATRVSRHISFVQEITKDMTIYLFFFILFHVAHQTWTE